MSEASDKDALIERIERALDSPPPFLTIEIDRMRSASLAMTDFPLPAAARERQRLFGMTPSEAAKKAKLRAKAKAGRKQRQRTQRILRKNGVTK